MIPPEPRARAVPMPGHNGNEYRPRNVNRNSHGIESVAGHDSFLPLQSGP
jgi:hypothetical protein